MLTALTNDGGGCRLSCRLQPKASRCAVAGRYGDSLKIVLTAPPVDGRANAALCAFVADLLKLPKSRVSLLSGQTSRNKVLRIDGMSAETVSGVLEKLIPEE